MDFILLRNLLYNLDLDVNEVLKGSQAFTKMEMRDSMYNIATFLVEHFWGNPHKLADSIGVLLLTWNENFYKFGKPNLDLLELVLHNNDKLLESYRNRDISSFNFADEVVIKTIFLEFIDALKVSQGKNTGHRSPVSASKALHIIAPHFFPLWDKKISKKYRCFYDKDPAEKFIKFMKITQEQVENLHGKIQLNNKSLLKIIDEYNYSKFTKNWI